MLLTAKELARQLDVHITTIRRAYRGEEIPYERLGKLYFFDLDQVRQAMRVNSRNLSHAVGAARPATSAAARVADQPPTGKTGRPSHGSQGGNGERLRGIHPDHRLAAIHTAEYRGGGRDQGGRWGLVSE